MNAQPSLFSVCTSPTPNGVMELAGFSALSRAQKLLDHHPTDPASLAPSCPMRVLHDLVRGDIEELEGLREEVNQKDRAAEVAEEELSLAKERLAEEREILAAVREAFGVDEKADLADLCERISDVRDTLVAYGKKPVAAPVPELAAGTEEAAPAVQP